MSSSCDKSTWITYPNMVLVGANNFSISNVSHSSDCLSVCDSKVFNKVC